MHEIKINYKFFADVIAGKKRAEVREFDRDYKVYDILRMRPVDHDGAYLGDDFVDCRIVHVCDLGAFFLGKNYALLSIELWGGQYGTA